MSEGRKNRPCGDRNAIGLAVAVCAIGLCLQGCFPWRAPARLTAHTSLAAARADAPAVMYLNLSEAGVTNWPQGLADFPNLQRLSLRNARIGGALPDAIGELTGLQWLDLASMGLTSICPRLQALDSVTTLYLSGNKLAALDPSIGGMAALQYLNLDDNELTELPPSIGQASSLRWLRLNNNKLTSLPEEIGQLAQLERLYLRNNELVSLPAGVQGLERLTDLSLTGNKLTQLPLWLLEMKSLKRLDLKGNALTRLPEDLEGFRQLEWLRLERNKIPVDEQQRVQKALPDCLVIL